jgi:MFS transporter, ACS family, hexuronate transporter
MNRAEQRQSRDEGIAPVRQRTRLRWFVCGLLFFATTVNYLDRQVLGILKPLLGREMHWSEADYGWIISSFQLAYALMMPIAGRLIDWLGVRTGYALAVLIWSVASMSHSVARTTAQFIAARFFLGVGESSNFPAAIKTVSDWFPRQERAFATGIFNSGSNLGAIAAPLLVPFIAARLGWRPVFLVTGALDLVWLAAWLSFYRRPAEHPKLSTDERAYIEAGQGLESPVRVRYLRLVGTKEAWSFILGKFLTDPVWWFYLFWIPGFLNQNYGLSLTQLGPPLVAIYLAADLGSILGGWFPARFLAIGWGPNRSRKVSMLICACAALPVMFLMSARTLLPAVILLSLATAAHQGWSANLFTLVSDTFPSRAVASVTGLGGFAGSFGGMLAAPLIGHWLDFSHGAYRPMFIAGGCAYLFALCVIQVLVPRLRPARLDSV